MKSQTKTFLLTTSNLWQTILATQIINSENPSYLINDKINEYIEESNGNKYLMLVSTDESKNIRKKYEELWNKI